MKDTTTTAYLAAAKPSTLAYEATLADDTNAQALATADADAYASLA